MIALGIDQARRSGWGLSINRRVVECGVACTHRERLAVLELVRDRNCRSLRGVLVMFEDHSGMPLSRLTRHDAKSARKSGRFTAPERTTASILGQGAAHGRWLELLDMLEHPKAWRLKVEPRIWRARLGIRAHGTDDLKRAACLHASALLGRKVDDGDLAEGVCLAQYAGLDGVMRLEMQRAERRIAAREKRQTSGQVQLLELLEPANDNGRRKGKAT